MKPERKPFQPLGTDDMDSKIENLAREKGVGALVKPAKGEQGSSALPLPPMDPAPVAEHAPQGRRKALNIDLPDYVWTELKIRAAHRQTSVRHVVMTALLAEGFHIEEADMIEDGRRLRGKGALHH